MASFPSFSYLVDDELWLVMEYMDGGTLSDAINEMYISEYEMAAISRECLQGLDFLHSNYVIHRDVKSYNILLRTDGSVKLADFGISAQLTPEQNRRSSVVGTSWWMAPEVVERSTIWPQSGHMVSWNCGKSKWWNDKFLTAMKVLPSAELLIATGGTPQLQQPNLFSALLRHFLSCCLQKNEEQRWSAKELLQHPFVTSAKPASVLLPLIQSVKKWKEEEKRWRCQSIHSGLFSS
ncbi:serine/threonine-protein kinase PAK 1-like [Corvus moneduloides]|uniref:serine/threonine-protein kinase PAK 1-like n=1 Tax=Corvus moneduloides TaxID=1196302 RepID=UPI001363438E|nr:serine/threonine-protein kinase PAK 1-like [Corvus moneduloides]